VRSICNDSCNSSERSRLVFYRSPYCLGLGERTEDIFTRRPRYNVEAIKDFIRSSLPICSTSYGVFLKLSGKPCRAHSDTAKISFEGRSASVEAASYPIGIWASRQIVTNSGMLLKVANSDIMISSLARSEPWRDSCVDGQSPVRASE